MRLVSKSVLASALLLACSLTFRAPAQQPAPPPPTHPTSTPYTGDLSVFEDPTRADKLHINRVMDMLRITPGKTVADIGAGGGWFSVRAADRVGPTGKVIAEDINQHAVDSIRDRAARENHPNIQPLLGTPDDPKLPPNSIDAALMLRVYHEVANPPILLAHLLTAMKPGALFGVIDHNGNGADHGINADIVRDEVKRAGFHYTGHYDFTRDDQNDYFLLFSKQ
jgi:predicted methyltransferase